MQSWSSVAQGEREQPAVAGLLQHADRLPAGLLGVRSGCRAVHHCIRDSHRRHTPSGPRIPPCAVLLDGVLPGPAASLSPRRRVALDRVLREQLGLLVGGEPVCVLEHETEMCDRLTVRASTCASRRPPGRTRRCVQVTCLRGVMDDPRHVRSVPVDQGVEHALVQGHQPAAGTEPAMARRVSS